jgi:hypothetical protein
MELLLYQKANAIMSESFASIAEEAIREEVESRRHLAVVDSLI